MLVDDCERTFLILISTQYEMRIAWMNGLAQISYRALIATQQFERQTDFELDKEHSIGKLLNEILIAQYVLQHLMQTVCLNLCIFTLIIITHVFIIKIGRFTT